MAHHRVDEQTQPLIGDARALQPHLWSQRVARERVTERRVGRARLAGRGRLGAAGRDRQVSELRHKRCRQPIGTPVVRAPRRSRGAPPFSRAATRRGCTRRSAPAWSRPHASRTRLKLLYNRSGDTRGQLKDQRHSRSWLCEERTRFEVTDRTYTSLRSPSDRSQQFMEKLFKTADGTLNPS